jgi:hypothetical protein
MAARMNRRDWLKLFSTGVVGAMVLDPEKLLWVPGEKTIFLPPATTVLQAESSVVYSVWQLALRTADHDPMSTRALMGDGFVSHWDEILRTESIIVYENKVDELRDRREKFVGAGHTGAPFGNGPVNRLDSSHTTVWMDDEVGRLDDYALKKVK